MSIRANLFLLVLFIVTIFVGATIFIVYMASPLVKISNEVKELRNLTEQTLLLRGDVLAMQTVKLHIQYNKVYQTKLLFDKNFKELDSFKYLPELNLEMAEAILVFKNLYANFTRVWENDYRDSANEVMVESVRIFQTDMLTLNSFLEYDVINSHPDKEAIIGKIDKLKLAIALVNNNLSLAYKIMSQQFKTIDTAIRKREQHITIVLIMTLIFSIFGLVFISLFISFRIRKQEYELKQTKNYLTNIIESMPSLLIGINGDNSITQWNHAAQEISGLSRDEVLGKLLKDVVPDISTVIDEILQSGKTLGDLPGVKRIRRDKGKVVYENIIIYPLKGENISGAVIKIDNVTKEHLMQEMLNHNQKIDALGQLAGGVAHDFNNMLAGIMGAAELLKMHTSKKQFTEKDVVYVKMIIDTAQKAADLTKRLLLFGRKGDIVLKSVNIHNMLHDSNEMLVRTIDKKISITINANAENYIIDGDNSALQNAILNLGINSSHAMPDGGTVLIETKNIILDLYYCDKSPFDIKAGEYIKIEINDSGKGIPLENLERIFEPFFTTKDLGKGTGLGLSAVYGTVQNHKGAITVYSEEGIGTSFHIFIPCSNQDRILEQSNNKIIPGTGQILLVDDEEIIRLTGKRLLENMGYSVLLAENGFEAVSVFKKEYKKIDLVIMDMIMPAMRGDEAFYKMKEIDSACKIIIASGFSKGESLSELRESGLTGFINKPFHNYELSQLIGNILGNNL